MAIFRRKTRVRVGGKASNSARICIGAQCGEFVQLLPFEASLGEHGIKLPGEVRRQLIMDRNEDKRRRRTA
jgi:hypothetical protein